MLLFKHLTRVSRLSRSQQYAFSLFNKFNANKDYYQILGVDKKASVKEVKDAYYSLAKKYHPDLNKGYEEKFKEINEAHNILAE